MKTLAALSLAAGLALSLTYGFSAPSQADAWAGKPCARSAFKTDLVKQACKDGGQTAAKKAMKDFVKKAKKTEPDLACDSCHTKVGGDFPLTKDGVTKFEKLAKTVK
jgi:hypothetical protein